MSDTIKLQQFNTLLDLGTLLVFCDGRAVSGLPNNELRTAPQVALRVGHGLTPPIDLLTGSSGFSATLMFNGVEERVAVPWRSVYLLVGEGSPRFQCAFPDSLPQAERLDAPPQKRGALFSVD